MGIPALRRSGFHASHRANFVVSALRVSIPNAFAPAALRAPLAKGAARFDYKKPLRGVPGCAGNASQNKNHIPAAEIAANYLLIYSGHYVSCSWSPSGEWRQNGLSEGFIPVLRDGILTCVRTNGGTYTRPDYLQYGKAYCAAGWNQRGGSNLSEACYREKPETPPPDDYPDGKTTKNSKIEKYQYNKNGQRKFLII